MHHGQELEVRARSAMFAECLIVGVVVPRGRMGLGRKTKHHHAALARAGAFKGHGVVVVGKKAALMALKNRKKAFLIFTIAVGVVNNKIGDHITGVPDIAISL